MTIPTETVLSLFHTLTRIKRVSASYTCNIHAANRRPARIHRWIELPTHQKRDELPRRHHPAISPGCPSSRSLACVLLLEYANVLMHRLTARSHAMAKAI